MKLNLNKQKVKCFFEKFYYEGEILEINQHHIILLDIVSNMEIMLPIEKTVIKRLPIKEVMK